MNENHKIFMGWLFFVVMVGVMIALMVFLFTYMEDLRTHPCEACERITGMSCNEYDIRVSGSKEVSFNVSDDKDFSNYLGGLNK